MFKRVLAVLGIAVAGIALIGFHLAFQVFTWGLTILIFWYVFYWIGWVSTGLLSLFLFYKQVKHDKLSIFVNGKEAPV